MSTALTSLVLQGLLRGEGEESSADGLTATIESRYAKDETDEFLKPIIANKDGCISDDDTLVFFDFRADRMREIGKPCVCVCVSNGSDSYSLSLICSGVFGCRNAFRHRFGGEESFRDPIHGI